MQRNTMTFAKGEELLRKGRNGCRKLGNNTWLERLDNDTLGIRLHRTYVVKVHRDGTYTLNTGGWESVTTKDRINAFAPCCVYQRNWRWFVNEVPFVNGMKVDSEGRLVA